MCSVWFRGAAPPHRSVAVWSEAVQLAVSQYSYLLNVSEAAECSCPPETGQADTRYDGSCHCLLRFALMARISVISVFTMMLDSGLAHSRNAGNVVQVGLDRSFLCSMFLTVHGITIFIGPFVELCSELFLSENGRA